jgi:hypothetical protein
VTLKIDDSTMTSYRSAHTAQQSSSGRGWEVSWLPGQTLDRNTAITAMILADTAAERDLAKGHRLWPHFQSWAEELGLTAPEAIVRVSQPPSDPTRQQEQAGRQPDREAADCPAGRSSILATGRVPAPGTPHDPCMRPITA